MKIWNHCLSKAFARLGAACLAAGALVAGPALAAPGLIGDSVNVALTGSGIGIDTSDTVVVGAGLEFTPGNSTNIGDSVLLPGTNAPERIDIGAFTIYMRFLGYEYEPEINPGVYTAGLDPAAKFVFSGLDIVGETIIGVAGVASGVTNFNAAWFTLDGPHQVSFAIGDVVFLQAQSGDTFGEFTITLTTERSTEPPPNPAPEPGSLALAGLALGSLGWARRRRVARVG